MMFTPLLPGTAVRVFVLVALLVSLVLRGLIPAFTAVDTDFPNYYTAARLVLEGKDVRLLYDDRWFQEQIDTYGIHQSGKFSPFPPPTVLPFLPLALFPPGDALRIMTILNLVMLTAVVLLLRRAIPTTTGDAVLLVLLAGVGLANNFRFGQLYIAVALFITAGYVLAREGRPILAGCSLGLMIPLKYFPAVFLLFHAARGEWRVVLTAAATAAAVVVAGILVLGWEVHEQFLTAVAGGHLTGDLSLQNPFSSSFQSFDSLFKRLFVHDPLLNPDPLVAAPFLVPVLKSALIAGVGGLLVVLLRAMSRSSDMRLPPLLYALLGIGGLLIAPATATYHWVLLWLPAGLLLAATAGDREARVLYWIAFTSYALAGFIPYRLVAAFDGTGPGTVLAYPRLLLLVLLFFTCARATVRLLPGAQRTEGPA